MNYKMKRAESKLKRVTSMTLKGRKTIAQENKLVKSLARVT